MPAGIWTLIIQVALLVLKIIGAKEQTRRNFLDWVEAMSADTTSSINMKDEWKVIHKELKEKLEAKKSKQKLKKK